MEAIRNERHEITGYTLEKRGMGMIMLIRNASEMPSSAAILEPLVTWDSRILPR